MKDKVSALFDGDLDDQGMRAVFDGMRKDASLRKEWDTYCLIGDTLRGDSAGSSDFVSRVMVSLDDEPTLLALCDEVLRRSGPMEALHVTAYEVEPAFQGALLQTLLEIGSCYGLALEKPDTACHD